MDSMWLDCRPVIVHCSQCGVDIQITVQVWGIVYCPARSAVKPADKHQSGWQMTGHDRRPGRVMGLLVLNSTTVTDQTEINLPLTANPLPPLSA